MELSLTCTVEEQLSAVAALCFVCPVAVSVPPDRMAYPYLVDAINLLLTILSNSFFL
jgi:hypothetical protein